MVLIYHFNNIMNNLRAKMPKRVTSRRSAYGFRRKRRGLPFAKET